MKMTQEQLDDITIYLIEHVFNKFDIMYADDPDPEKGDRFYDLVTIVASLHNLLYEAVTGKRYDYMFHWANKIGAYCDDTLFDDIMKKEKKDHECKK